MKFLMKYKFVILACISILILNLYDTERAYIAVRFSGFNIAQFLMMLPPIFILIGLLEVWVPKETMIKYLGKDSGIKGLFIVLFLGSFSAGPMFIAFPIGLLLLQKGARLAYVIFFLGVWSSTKIPILIFEVTSMGVRFTIYHVFVSLVLYLLVAFIMEKILDEKFILQAGKNS